MSSHASDQPDDSGSHQPDLERITVVAIGEHVVCHLDGEAVVLHLAKGAATMVSTRSELGSGVGSSPRCRPQRFEMLSLRSTMSSRTLVKRT